MSEGPEVHRIAGVLTEEFGGSRIVAIDSRLKKARAWIEEHPGLLEGKEIRRVYAAGKNLIWDLEDDTDGNVQHLREHEVTIEEAEEVLLDPQSNRAVSRTSGLPTVFGWTSTGRHLAVVYEVVDDPLTLRPVTAYDVPPPGPRSKRRKR